MAVKKLVDSKYISVKGSQRNPDDERVSGFVGGVVIKDGTAGIKHYRFQLDEEISIPEDFVTQLKNRSMVGKAKDGTRAYVPIYLVEKV